MKFTYYQQLALAIFYPLQLYFSNFSCMFLNPNIFFQFDINCSNLLDIQFIQVKKAFCYQKYVLVLFFPQLKFFILVHGDEVGGQASAVTFWSDD